MIYRLIYQLVLRRVDAERAHVATARGLALLAAVPGARALMRRLLHVRDPRLAIRALGHTFPTPLGVPAGVDKNATWFEGLGALGVGFVEVGTVTARAQPGSPRPRIVRLHRDRALVNWMGFPNDGAEAIAPRLRARRGDTILGVNVGKSKLAEPGEAIADYRAAVRLVADSADFLVLNVSSPNTPGLRRMQAADVLGPLVDAVREELARAGRPLPLLVKIAPDLEDAEIDAVADLALAKQLDGIVAINTTTSRAGLVEADRAGTQGGVSGAPLKARALEVLERLHRRTGGSLVLVSVGGIETAEDAWRRILAGATLIQGYTGFVYGGPLWPRRINRGLATLLDASGAATLQELVGRGTAMGAAGLEPATPTV